MSTRIIIQFTLHISYSFFYISIAGDPAEIPDTDEPVNESEEFCCMFNANLNGKKLLYGAEMDGIESDIKLDLNHVDLNKLNFVELKVNLRAMHENQKRNFLRFKLRNWWSQCFLAKIDKIVVGTRNQDGIVNELTEMEVKNIPRLVRVSSTSTSAASYTLILLLLFNFFRTKTFGRHQSVCDSAMNSLKWLQQK